MNNSKALVIEISYFKKVIRLHKSPQFVNYCKCKYVKLCRNPSISAAASTSTLWHFETLNKKIQSGSASI